jgi:hypothetical protein
VAGAATTVAGVSAGSWATRMRLLSARHAAAADASSVLIRLPLLTRWHPS